MFPALSNVIRAVTIPARTLALTFALFVIVIYTFTLLGFNYFREFTGHSKGSCGSLLECFLTMMHAGLLNGAGAVIAQDIVYEYSAWSRDAGMAAFDWLFWVFVTIVLLNCVFGIMLDTFAFLRDQQERQREIIQNYCFICCEPIGSFESKAKYNIHQQFEHNLLNYVFFIYHGACLQCQDVVPCFNSCGLSLTNAFPPFSFSVMHRKEDLRTGIEASVALALDDNDTSWIPILQSLRKQADIAKAGDSDKGVKLREHLIEDNDRLRLENAQLTREILALAKARMDTAVQSTSSPMPRLNMRKLDGV